MFRCLNLWSYKDLIVHKAWADFRADSQRTYLGIIWWALDPIINTFVYYLIFGVIMKRSTPNFVPFLLIGLVVWRWFDSSTRGAARSIYLNVSFVRQVAFPKAVFPLTMIATCTYQFFFSILVLFGALWLCHMPLTAYAFLFPMILIVEGFLIAAFSFILGSLVPFIPDLATLMDYVFRILFFLSGIFYKVSDLHQEWLKMVLRLNPMVVIIEASRDVLMYQKMPDWTALGTMTLVSFVGIYIGAWLISRFDLVYAKRIV